MLDYIENIIQETVIEHELVKQATIVQLLPDKTIWQTIKHIQLIQSSGSRMVTSIVYTIFGQHLHNQNEILLVKAKAICLLQQWSLSLNQFYD